MTTQNKFHLLAVAACYNLSPSTIYSSSSSGIYEMRSPFILKLLCSLVEMMKVIVSKARGQQEFIQPVWLCWEEACKLGPKTRGGPVKQQPLVLQNSQKEILNGVSLALQAGGEQYFHQLNDLSALASLRALQQDRRQSLTSCSQTFVLFPPTSSLEPEHVSGTAGSILNPTEGQPKAKISGRICFH